MSKRVIIARFKIVIFKINVLCIQKRLMLHLIKTIEGERATKSSSDKRNIQKNISKTNVTQCVLCLIGKRFS